VYDAAGQAVQLRRAAGTALEQAYATYGFSLNGKPVHVVDANGNHTQYVYDGFDRQTTWLFPSATQAASFNPATPASALATANAVNAADYEHYGHDAAGIGLTLSEFFLRESRKLART
jgi:YD repeat-containing protein